MPTVSALLQLARDIRFRLPPDAPLREVSTRAGWSPFHLHRAFLRLTGETPKRYALRLRLERAAARLVSTDSPVLRIAHDTGFASHEVFTRAFRRCFGRTPTEYRRDSLGGASSATRAAHAAHVDAAGPCVRLHHVSLHPISRRSFVPTLSINRREIAPQPVVFARLRTSRGELATAIGDGLGRAYAHAQQHGLALAGPPFVRYTEMGPGLMTIEAGFPVAVATPDGEDIASGTLQGGPVAVGLHGGNYDQLQDTYVAIERWMETNGWRASGPPWESYLTDPAEVPDPANWRTEVYWPLAPANDDTPRQ